MEGSSLATLAIIFWSFLGAVFLVIQWMQASQYLQGQIDRNRVGNDTMGWHFLLKFPVRIFLGHWNFECTSHKFSDH